MNTYKVFGEYSIEADTQEEARDILLGHIRRARFPSQSGQAETSLDQPLSPDCVLYQIVTEDVQQVAQEILGRPLTEEEILVVKKELGEYVYCFDTIRNCIRDRIDDD